jgi:hypothetical protein
MSALRVPFVVATAIGLAGFASPAGAAPLSDFDDGTLQGWVPNVEGIELTNPGSGGNPGGYALLVDVLPTGTLLLLAPGLALVALARRAARGVAGPRRRRSPGLHLLPLPLLAVALSVTPVPAQAASVFFGEDVNETGTTNADPQRIPFPNAAAAQAAFLALLIGVETEGFEDKSGLVTTLDFGPDTATLSPSLEVLTIPTGTFNGVYPISGDNVLLQATGAAESAFTITFSGPQAAFGFFATDIEFQGNLTLRFLLADGVTTLDRPVPTQAGTGIALNTGSVAYFGVIDTDNPFLAVSFVRGLNQNDGFGFDDLTIGRVENVVPEPGTLALVGLGVALVSVARRRSL